MKDQDQEMIPDNQLDAMWALTNPVWGKSTIPKQLRDRLMKNKGGKLVNEDGDEFEADEEGMWDLLSYFTRDLRLGNLSKAEAKECREWLEICSDCIRNQYRDSFFLSLVKVVALTEISQSRGGWLRKILRTNTSEQKIEYEEQPKRWGKKVER